MPILNSTTGQSGNDILQLGVQQDGVQTTQSANVGQRGSNGPSLDLRGGGPSVSTYSATNSLGATAAGTSTLMQSLPGAAAAQQMAYIDP